jgi:hypothetical protein
LRPAHGPNSDAGFSQNAADRRRSEGEHNDADLEHVARRVLLHSGIRGFTKLHVEVREGVATLFGTLPTEFERRLIVQLVQRVHGIQRVDAEISVRERGRAKQESHPAAEPRRRSLWPVAVIGVFLASAAAVWVSNRTGQTHSPETTRQPQLAAQQRAPFQPSRIDFAQ